MPKPPVPGPGRWPDANVLPFVEKLRLSGQLCVSSTFCASGCFYLWKQTPLAQGGCEVPLMTDGVWPRTPRSPQYTLAVTIKAQSVLVNCEGFDKFPLRG